MAKECGTVFGKHTASTVADYHLLVAPPFSLSLSPSLALILEASAAVALGKFS